jgi:bifunctional DNA-binding transcriptional regulator/antitoxin component of YhaV-PrlF toxin-antitoxin module
MSVLTLDELGRVQFPEAIRQALGLTQSSQLTIELQNDRIILIPVSIPNELAQPSLQPISESEGKLTRKGGVLVIEGEIEGNPDILNDIREERIREQMGL